MTLPTRSDVRTHLADLLRSRSIAQRVYDYRTEDFEGVSPVILVTSAGASRPRFTLKGAKTTFFLGIELFVLYADPDADPPWTESDAEAMLDTLEHEVAQILSDNVKSGPWQSITYEERSIITRVVVVGTTYVYEVLPIVVEVF